MADSVQVVDTTGFRKAVKRLKPKQKQDLDAAIRQLMASPLLGEQKKGDLSFMRVFTFKMAKQPTLLAYSFDDGLLILELITVGSHENFYRDIKRIF